eukprot:TRINITY_DN26226_c0_g1_i4.p1 TRINITY_DN26226_c0_g1~~TRINITY_DN26226_c0_g1_i4.p1  ORF type:complete len:263 (+),score=19.41 TRINITY_DN26226_c0_g1_i4:151-939(+)
MTIKRLHRPNVCNACAQSLADSTEYFRRLKVCKTCHAKDFVIFGNEKKRFCGKCGRFEPLHQFEGMKRSCIKKLLIHNRLRKIRYARAKNANQNKNNQHRNPSAILQLQLSKQRQNQSNQMFENTQQQKQQNQQQRDMFEFKQFIDNSSDKQNPQHDAQDQTMQNNDQLNNQRFDEDFNDNHGSQQFNNLQNSLKLVQDLETIVLNLTGQNLSKVYSNKGEANSFVEQVILKMQSGELSILQVQAVILLFELLKAIVRNKTT